MESKIISFKNGLPIFTVDKKGVLNGYLASRICNFLLFIDIRRGVPPFL